MPRIIALLAVLFVAAGLKAQMSVEAPDKTAAEIDAYLNSAVAAGKFNGVALVSGQGRTVLHKAYGWRDVAAKAYNDTSTRFPILSITKSFTAMVVFKLQEQGRLSLADPLTKYFPGFPNGDKITVSHLLDHTSGLYNYTDDIDEEDSALVNHPVPKERVFELITKKPPMHAPGEDMSYNNSGYYLAGLVIEKATGKTYEQNVRELLFEPLGMTNSGFDFSNLAKDVKATGYQFLNAQVQKPYTYLDSTVGYSAGAIYSTAGDMYKWTRAIAQRQILSPGSWNIAFTPKAGDYGIGFRVNQLFGNAYVKHSGGYPGFTSEFIYYPEKDITIILLRNSGNYGEDIWPVTMGLSSVMLGLPYDLWKLRKPVTLSEDVLKQKEGKYAADNLIISFAVKDRRLYEILPGGAELPLLAEDANSFYLENFNTSIRFGKEEGNDVVTIHEHGKDYKLKKAE
jgi:CubicO group peptidase (beta-lactamase class C family)